MKNLVKIDPTLMDEDKYAEHMVEESAEILMKSDEIKADAELMQKIQEYLDKKGKKIKSLQDLRDVASEKSKVEEE